MYISRCRIRDGSDVVCGWTVVTNEENAGGVLFAIPRAADDAGCRSGQEPDCVSACAKPPRPELRILSEAPPTTHL
jgi:hypothetical protein